MKFIQKQRRRSRRAEPHEQAWPLPALDTAGLDIDLDEVDELLEEQ
jgi:hypothetical protein